MTAAASGLGERNPRLDGLRGLAILLVVVYHASLLFRPQNAAETVLATAAKNGWAGVDLFFVLSGFLITGILVRTRESEHYFGHFYARRALRIFPLYYSVLILALVVMPQIAVLEPIRYFRITEDFTSLWYWLYLSNFYAASAGTFHHQLLSITWSLAIEEQFYLVWPLVVRFVSPRRLLWVCVAVLVLSPLLRVAAQAQGFSPLTLYVVTPFRLDGLAAGALVALAASRPGGIERLRRGARIFLPVGFTGIVAVLAWLRITPTPESEAMLPMMWRSPMQSLGYSLFALTFASLLVRVAFAPERSVAGAIFGFPGLRVLGRYSYSIYLFHTLVVWLVMVFGFNYAANTEWNVAALLLNWALVTAGSLTVALVTWHALEAPFQRLKSRFPYEGRRLSGR